MMQRIFTQERAHGFTLIEVLLALAIFSILLAALYGTLFASHKAVEGNEESLLKLHELRMTMDLISREIEAAVPKADDEFRLRVRDRDIFGRQASQVEFTTFLTPRAGAMKVSYHAEQIDENLVLYKTAYPAFAEPNNTREAEILDDIDSFTIEVSENGRWMKTWDVDRVPKAVRITISVPYAGRVLTLSETVIPKTGSRM